METGEVCILILKKRLPVNWSPLYLQLSLTIATLRQEVLQ